MTKLNEKTQDVANTILKAFETPDKLPEVIKNIFINDSDKPSSNWSFTNQIIMLCSDTFDARGYKQWMEVNRNVKKGSKAIRILAPMVIKDKKTDETKIIGFRPIPVFAYEDTEGEELANNNEKISQVLDSLPFLEVAKKWNIDIAIAESKGNYAGMYQRAGKDIKRIVLSVENLSTWAHEMIHASDDQLGNLNDGSEIEREYVAELGGCVILKLLGYEKEADIGGCYKYLKSYADNNNVDVGSTAIKYLDRVCKCVDLILSEMQNINNQAVA